MSIYNPNGKIRGRTQSGARRGLSKKERSLIHGRRTAWRHFFLDAKNANRITLDDFDRIITGRVVFTVNASHVPEVGPRSGHAFAAVEVARYLAKCSHQCDHAA